MSPAGFLYASNFCRSTFCYFLHSKMNFKRVLGQLVVYFVSQDIKFKFDTIRLTAFSFNLAGQAKALDLIYFLL